MIYSAQFPSGFEALVKLKLEADFKAKILVEEDGLILFLIKGIIPPLKLKKINYVSSLDAVLFWAKEERSLESLAASVSENNFKVLKIKRSEDFQLRTFINNQPSVFKDRDVFTRLISSSTGLELSSHKPCYIFNLKLRKSGLGIFSLKIKSDDKKYHQGELHQDVATLLCLFGELSRGDVVLDAFGGYGGITNSAKKFKPSKIIICENNLSLAAMLEVRFKDSTLVGIKNQNVIDLLDNSSFQLDLILADPPWGEFEKNLDIIGFYSSFLNSAKANLKPEGKIIIISSNKDALAEAVTSSGLSIKNQLDVLISGKKVRVYGLF